MLQTNEFWLVEAAGVRFNPSTMEADQPARPMISGEAVERRSARRGSPQARMPKAYKFCDTLTEAGIYTSVVFAPWAFGTTSRGTIWTLAIMGYFLGGLLLTKRIIRWRTGYQPARWGDEPGTGWSYRKIATLTFAVLTVVVLAFCFISAFNMRAVEYRAERRMEFIDDYIKWLPHSYNGPMSWFFACSYLGMAGSFWALRDWLLGKTSRERHREADADDASEDYFVLPDRWKRLLWVLCINGAVLGLVCILQRLSNAEKLLWLVEPAYSKGRVGFGPYPYRSNGAQYFNMLWPVCLGFWAALRQESRQTLRKTVRAGGEAHMVLLPCAVLMAACPSISLSRGGTLLAFAAVIGSLVILSFANRKAKWQTRAGIALMFLMMVAGSAYLAWEPLVKRMETIFVDNLGTRTEIYINAHKIADDFPVYGTGPGTFASVYYLYRENSRQITHAYAHNDWLETRVTFGRTGCTMIVAMLAILLTLWLGRGGVSVYWVFTALLGLGLSTCLLHSILDFPFQIHSLMHLFLTLGCIFACASRR